MAIWLEPQNPGCSHFQLVWIWFPTGRTQWQIHGFHHFLECGDDIIRKGLKVHQALLQHSTMPLCGLYGLCVGIDIGLQLCEGFLAMLEHRLSALLDLKLRRIRPPLSLALSSGLASIFSLVTLVVGLAVLISGVTLHPEILGVSVHGVGEAVGGDGRTKE
jgi:hypothetical protein